MSMLKKAFAPVALAVAALSLAGCGETPEQLAQKPAVVQQMVENSASVCETGPVHADASAYAERLTKVLSDAKLSSLKTLQDRHITVCLDQRLASQKTNFWYGDIQGVYYPGQNGKPGVMSYVDDGRQPAEGGFWSSNDAYYRGSDSVDELASDLSKGAIAPGKGLETVELYGKNHYPSWDAASTSPKAAINLNPQLQQPPLKALAAKPAS